MKAHLALAALLLLPPAPAEAQGPVSLSLDSAQALARGANVGLGIARLRVIEARSRRLGRHTDYFPRLATEATFTEVGTQQALAIPRGAFGLLSTGEPVPGQAVVVPQGGTSLFLQTTRIEQPVTQLFKVRAGHRAAVAEERSAEARFRQAEGDLSLAVERAYSGLLASKVQYLAAAARVAADSAVAYDARGSKEAGLVLAGVADQADTRFHESRRQLRELGYRIEDLSLDLAELLGAPSGTLFDVTEPVDSSTAPGSPEEYAGAALAGNPELVAATQQLARAREGVAAARAEYLPQVGVFIQHLFQKAVPFLPASHFSVGVKAEWTIWDFRQRGYAVAERRSLQEQARLDLERTRRRIEGEVTKAFRALTRARETAEVAAEAAAARREASRLAADQVASGMALPSVGLAAEAARLQADADLFQARLGVRLAQAALDRVAGKRRP